jgi:poly(beta-D-mannuronate) lyase
VPPARDLIGVSFYVDKNHSVADPALKRQNEEAVRPVRTFVANVTGLADGWMRSSPANGAYATLALQQLSTWASAGALLDEVNRQGGYERKWTLGSLALAFLKIRAAPALDSEKLAATRDWLSKVAYAVIPPYEDMSNSASRNNHAYWAGLAVAASGVATNDRHLFDWGMARARMGISDIRADGTLPREMERGSLALHYHAFALPPLVMLAEIGAANDLDLYDENDGALRRLADRVIQSVEAPASFEKLAGATQEFPLETHPKASYFAWGEAYYARFRDPRLWRWLASGLRPLVDQRLGGDQTLAFGVFPR